MLQRLPEQIGNLKNLRFLYLQKNRLSEIPLSIGNCQKLQELDVAYCGVIILPYTLSDIQKLDLVYIDTRTTCFYPQPKNVFRQKIIVVDFADTRYRSSQTMQ
jgi:Leucine-rich repeat (LRR) protein